MLYSAVPRSSQCPSICTRAPAFALSQSAFALKVARAGSDRAALSKSKLTSFSGPPDGLSPLRKASRLEVAPGSDFGGAVGWALAVGAPDDALGFSAVHLPGGGLAGFPQEIRKIIANKPKP